MSYYPEKDSHIRDKVKVELYLSNYETKKELDQATSVDASDLAAKKDLFVMKDEVEKLGISKLVNFSRSLSNLKTKVDDLDVDKLKAVPSNLKKISDVVDKEVFNSTKSKTLKTKANNLERKILDVTTVIHINQYNTDKQNLEEKIGDIDEKVVDASGLVTKTILNTKISEAENKILNHDKYITTPEFNNMTTGNFAARLKRAHLVSKNDFDNKQISFNRRITTNKT